MSALTKGRKDEIAKELEVAASWVGGPRQVKLLALAKEIGGLSTEEATDEATKALAAADAGTAKPTDEELAAGKKAEDAAAAKAAKDAAKR